MRKENRASSAEPLLLDLQSAAMVLGCTVKGLRCWIRDGRLPHVRLGRVLRVRRSDLERVVANGLGPVPARVDRRRARGGQR